MISNYDRQKQGNISIYTEAATKDSLVTGYVKPIIKDLKVVNWEKDKDKRLKIAWEAVIGSVTWVFKNHGKDQLATKVEFEGNLKAPSTDTWEIIAQVLHNAFIQALYPSLENSVSINSVNKEEKRSRIFFRKYLRIKSSLMIRKKEKKNNFLKNIKMKKDLFVLFALMIPLLFSGCAVVGDIFKAGVWVSMIIVIAIIALVIFLIRKGMKNS
jgi:hypothetical protein